MRAEGSLDEAAGNRKGRDALTELRLKTPFGQLIMPDSFLDTVAAADEDAAERGEFPGATAALAIRVENSGGGSVWGTGGNERGACWCCVAMS